MRHRRVDDCEEFASEYIQDLRFADIAKYAVKNGGINFSLEDFKFDEDELVNIPMFFYCFEDSCDGLSFQRRKKYILSQNAFEELLYIYNNLQLSWNILLIRPKVLLQAEPQGS